MSSAIQHTHAAVDRPERKTRSRRDYAVARPVWAAPAIAALTLLFAVPLAHNAWQSLTKEEATADAFFYYRKIISDPYYRGVLFETLSVSFIVTVLCLLLSYPVAYYLARHARRSRPAILFLLVAPLLTSVIMRTLGIRLILAKQGLLNALLDIVSLGP